MTALEMPGASLRPPAARKEPDDTTAATATAVPAKAGQQEQTHEPAAIRKVSIVVSHGSLEGIYPGLIMANGARMEGIEANLFFTFFGLDAITRKKQDKIRVATVGNPAMGIPTLLGALPGMSALATKMMARKMEALDIPPIPEFIQLCADSGVRLFACKASVDMFALTKADFVETVEDIITVGEFYAMAAGGEIIFT